MHADSCEIQGHNLLYKIEILSGVFSEPTLLSVYNHIPTRHPHSGVIGTRICILHSIPTRSSL